MPRYKLHPVSARSRAPAASVKRRAEERASVYTIAALVSGQDLSAPVSCTVHDISKSGARLEIDRIGIRGRAPRPARLPEDLTVHFCPSRRDVRCRLSWQDGRHFGVEFTAKIEPKQVSGRLDKTQLRVR